jgi:5-methylcytosine-specific restriction endonuclease McrA
MELAKKESDIQSSDLVEIINAYYRGNSKTMSNKVNVLRTALRLLGYKGNFIGRIHKNGTSYEQLRHRENTAARRWGLKNASCDRCGSTELLRIHHIVPLAWGGKTSEENIATLCEVCHRKAHRNLSKLLTRTKLLEYLAPHYAEIESLAKQSV